MSRATCEALPSSFCMPLPRQLAPTSSLSPPSQREPKPSSESSSDIATPSLPTPFLRLALQLLPYRLLAISDPTSERAETPFQPPCLAPRARPAHPVQRLSRLSLCTPPNLPKTQTPNSGHCEPNARPSIKQSQGTARKPELSRANWSVSMEWMPSFGTYFPKWAHCESKHGVAEKPRGAFRR